MAQKRELVKLGARDLDLTRAVRAGDVIRARQGWYTVLDPRSTAVQAVRVGGRLTGISAIIAFGGWAETPSTLHVAVPANAARLRSRNNRHRGFDVRNTRGVTLHWESAAVGSRGSAVSVSLRDALIRVALDEPDEVAIAALDWVASTGALDRFDLAELALELPKERRFLISRVDWHCGGLPESLARTRLIEAGHAVRSQVPVAGAERIDIVIDEHVGLEIDGRTHHAHTFERDSAKALSIAVEGRLPLRVGAQAVFHDWARVELAIRCMFENSGVAVPERRRKPVHRRFRRGRRTPTPEFPNTPARVGPRRGGDGAAD